MKIIRDNELGGLMMIPLLCQWGIRRCNVKDCREKPTTIVTRITPDISQCGLCEAHFQELNSPDGIEVTLIFDDFDAFKEVQ